MWAKAASLASIERAGGLPEAYTVRVDFRKPLLLPSHVRFGHRRTDNTIDFALYNGDQTQTHLVGQLQTR
jgi:hypothetical protein